MPRVPRSKQELLEEQGGRWTPRRKRLVLQAIVAGELSVSEACARWEISLEELRSWQRAFQRPGTAKLKIPDVLP